MVELDLEKVEKILDLIEQGLELVEPAVGAYMAATQLRPDIAPGFMGFVSNPAALVFGQASGVPQPNALSVSVSKNPDVVAVVGQAIVFAANIPQGSSLGPYGFHWDFGDGGTSDEAAPTHIYKGEGSFRGTVSVVDSRGATGFAEFSQDVGMIHRR
jgi:hypothetical protein